VSSQIRPATAAHPPLPPPDHAGDTWVVDGRPYQWLSLEAEPGGVDALLALAERLRGLGWHVPECLARREAAVLLGPLEAPPADADSPRDAGRALAAFHVAAAGEPIGRGDPHGPGWLRGLGTRMRLQLEPATGEVLAEALRVRALYRFADLPTGVCLGRVLDLPQAAEPWALQHIPPLAHDGPWLLDLAGLADAQCRDRDGALDTDRLQGLLNGYAALRPLRAIERGAWPIALRAAALRAWIEALAGQRPEAAEAAQARLADYAARETVLQRIWVSGHR
jgi:homoserine kinase type II